MYRKRWKDPSVASSVAQCQTCSIVLPQNHIALLNGALSYTPFKGLRKTSPPYTLLLPSGTSAVQTRAGCEQRGRTERPRCSGLQPHAFHSDMKARSSPSSKATSREKKYREEKGGRVEKKILRLARLLNMDVLLAESKAVRAYLAKRSISHVFS